MHHTSQPIEMLTDQNVIFTAYFDPISRHLLRVLKCLERVGDTAYFGMYPEYLIISQQPKAIDAAKHVATWSRFQYPLVGLTEERLYRTLVCFTVDIGRLMVILKAVEHYTHGFIQIFANGVMRVLARTATTMAEAENLSLGQPGVVCHEIQCDTINDANAVLAEPVIPQPAIAFHLPEIRNKIARLSKISRFVTVSANTGGSFILRIESTLTSMEIKFPRIRILPTQESSDQDMNQLHRVKVSLDHLNKVLSHVINLSGILVVSSTICAIVPGNVLVLSTKLSNGDISRSGNMTFYVPVTDPE